MQTFGENAAGGGSAGEAAQQSGDRRNGTPGGRGGGRGGRGGDDRRKSGGRGGGRGDGDGRKGGGSLSEDLQKLVKLIHDRNFEPAIVFSFSRRWGQGRRSAQLHRHAQRLRCMTHSRRSVWRKGHASAL